MKQIVRAAVSMIGASLVGCASVAPPQTEELIVEGDEQSYPAFELAAKSCDFAAMERKSDSRGGYHFNIFVQIPHADADRCILDWLDKHPATGLTVAGH